MDTKLLLRLLNFMIYGGVGVGGLPSSVAVGASVGTWVGAGAEVFVGSRTGVFVGNGIGVFVGNGTKVFVGGTYTTVGEK